jgi:hypothetical protein
LQSHVVLSRGVVLCLLETLPCSRGCHRKLSLRLADGVGPRDPLDPVVLGAGIRAREGSDRDDERFG